MEKQNFETIIKLITNRDLTINTTNNIVELNKQYSIYYNGIFNFTFKTPKHYDSLLSTFINQYSKKFKQVQQKYIDLFNFKNQNAYMKNHCYTSVMLLDEIKENFKKDSVINYYSRYGFYSTEYGIGIFVQFLSEQSFDNMEKFLLSKNIPYSLEYSTKEYVLRFKIKVSKDFHQNLLENFAF